MDKLRAALWAEWIKVRRSRVVGVTFLAFSLLPFIGGFFMILMKNPEAGKNAGIMNQKAQMLTGTADWPTFLSLITQGMAVGGLIIFGFAAAWVFGREHADRTMKDLLALPVPRGAIVLAKFLAFSFVCLAMGIGIFGEALLVGKLVEIPGWSQPVFSSFARVYFTTTFLTIALSFPVAFFAHWGKGYLSALGFVIFSMVMAQIVAVAGLGPWFPWSIPALYSNIEGAGSQIGPVSFFIVLATGAAGLAATLWRWRGVDQ